MQLGQRGPHRHAELGVQVGQRLVHQERLRLADDRAAHGHALPLAAGQRGRLALEVLLQAEHPGHLGDPAPDLVLRRLALLQAEGEVLLDGHVRVERVVLEHHRDVAVLGRQVVDDPAADGDRARGDLLQPGDRPQRGRLAAAGGPDEDHELAVVDVQAQAVDALGPARIDLVHLVKHDLRHELLSRSGSAAGRGAAGAGDARLSGGCLFVTDRRPGRYPGVSAETRSLSRDAGEACAHHGRSAHATFSRWRRLTARLSRCWPAMAG